jgi:hypothetical protein
MDWNYSTSIKVANYKKHDGHNYIVVSLSEVLLKAKNAGVWDL